LLFCYVFDCSFSLVDLHKRALGVNSNVGALVGLDIARDVHNIETWKQNAF